MVVGTAVVVALGVGVGEVVVVAFGVVEAGVVVGNGVVVSGVVEVAFVVDVAAVVVVTSDAEVDWELKEKKTSINKRCFPKTWLVKGGAVAEWC